MRLVSLVPSWTETLLEAGLDVVGRTRFCVHAPASIPRIGGTKDWKLAKVRALQPDLLVLDEEENPRFMAEAGLPFWASRILAMGDVAPALSSLAGVTGAEALEGLAARWRRVVASPGGLPEVEWGRKPVEEVTSVVYLIWKDPWMAVGPSTFIGSVLEWMGWRCHPFPERYPTVDLATLPPSTLLLFSSEPYPFHRKREGLDALGFPYAFVDGESFSWFGVRALRFLENLIPA